MMKHIQLLSMSSMLLVLAACGGGGGPEDTDTSSSQQNEDPSQDQVQVPDKETQRKSFSLKVSDMKVLRVSNSEAVNVDLSSLESQDLTLSLR